MSYGLRRSYPAPAPTSNVTVTPRVRPIGFAQNLTLERRTEDAPREISQETGSITEATIQTGGSILLSLGNGLSRSRIGMKIDAQSELARGTLSGMVQYALDHLETPEYRMIGEAIHARMQGAYMVVVNNQPAEPSAYLNNTHVTAATRPVQRAGMEIPCVDIAIVSAEEGGGYFRGDQGRENLIGGYQRGGSQ